jgi:hypothetical protein
MSKEKELLFSPNKKKVKKKNSTIIINDESSTGTDITCQTLDLNNNINSYNASSNLKFNRNSNSSISLTLTSDSNSNLKNDKTNYNKISNLKRKISSSKATNDKFHQLFPSVPMEEYVIDTYSCAYVKSLNLYQGVMFLTQNYICFYSKIIKNENILKLKLTDIKEIVKTMHAVIFPTAIRINTQNSSYSFTSFRSRSHTLDHLLFLLNQARERQNDSNKLKILALNDDGKLLNEQSNSDDKNTSTTTLVPIDNNDSEHQQKINITPNSSIQDESNANSDESLLNESNNTIDLNNDTKKINKNNRQSNQIVNTNNFYSSYYTRPDMIYDFDCDLSRNMVRVSLRHKRSLLQKVKILLSLLIPGFFDMSRLDALLPICFIMCVLLLLNAFVLLNKVNQVDDLFTEILSKHDF